MTALLFLHPLRLLRSTAVATRISAIVCALVLVTAPASAQAPFEPDSKVQVLLQQLVNSYGVHGLSASPEDIRAFWDWISRLGAPLLC